MMLYKLCDTDRCQWHYVMPMAMAIVSHDQKSHIAAHFDCFDITNAVVPLTLLMVSCHVSISANGLT